MWCSIDRSWCRFCDWYYCNTERWANPSCIPSGSPYSVMWLQHHNPSSCCVNVVGWQWNVAMLLLPARLPSRPRPATCPCTHCVAQSVSSKPLTSWYLTFHVPHIVDRRFRFMVFCWCIDREVVNRTAWIRNVLV